MASINKESSSSNSSSLLARLFALECVDRYLRCANEGDAGQLEFSVEVILDEPRTMFEAEPTSIPGVVHIRCTFNNKYLRRDSKSSQNISALAIKKSEDTQGWDCTLFEILPSKQGGGQIQLRHIQLGYYLAAHTNVLYAYSIMPSDSVSYFNFTFIDWSSLVILPRYVAFKGPNGKYLNAKQVGKSDKLHLQFRSKDKGEEGVTMEVIPNADGSLRIRQGPGQGNLSWAIYANASVGFGPPYSARYQAVKDEINRISFKDVISNKFCRIKDVPFWPNSYVADSSSITQDTKLIVEEAVMRRTLKIEWRLQDARVYNVVPSQLNCSTHENNSSSPVTKSVTLTYETAVTTSFGTSHTCCIGIKTTITTPFIPFIKGSMNIEKSAQYGGSYKWGEPTTIKHSYRETDNYTIAPWTRLVMQKISTKGYCDVPYNYVQTDYLFNGDIIRTNKEDGVYKGINYFNIHTSNKNEPLPGSLQNTTSENTTSDNILGSLIILLVAWICIVVLKKFSKYFFT